VIGAREFVFEFQLSGADLSVHCQGDPDSVASVTCLVLAMILQAAGTFLLIHHCLHVVAYDTAVLDCVEEALVGFVMPTSKVLRIVEGLAGSHGPAELNQA